MTKPELVNKIAEKSNLSKKDAAAALTALTDVITEALKAEGKQAIPSLGTFELRERAARIFFRWCNINFQRVHHITTHTQWSSHRKVIILN